MQNKVNANQLQFFPIESHKSAEEFLLNTFSCSKAKLKKYFDKKFLGKSLDAHKPIQVEINFINDGLISPSYVGPEIEIVYEDSDFIVLNKPHNVFVHPLTYNEHNNCLSFLRSINKASEVNRDNYDRGLLYRLDFETSGVLVLTKSDSIYQSVRTQFDSLVKSKIYQLIVQGNCQQKGLIETYIRPTMQSGSVMKVANGKDEKDSLLAKLEILDCDYNSSKNLSFIKVKLLTGHRHQIRIQMKSIGHPILGDILYGGEASDRLYLHALEYQLYIQNKSYLWQAMPSNWL